MNHQIINTFLDMKHQLSLSKLGPIFDAVDIAPYEKTNTWPDIWGSLPPSGDKHGVRLVHPRFSMDGPDMDAKRARPHGPWRLMPRRSRYGNARLHLLDGWVKTGSKKRGHGNGRFHEVYDIIDNDVQSNGEDALTYTRP